MYLYVSSETLRSIMHEIYANRHDMYKGVLLGRNDEENGIGYVAGIFIPPQTLPKNVAKLSLDDLAMNYEAWGTMKIGKEYVVGMLLYQNGRVVMGVPKKVVKKKKHLLNVFGLWK